MNDFISHTGETLLDMRQSLEKEKKNNLAEFYRNDQKIYALQNILDQLPNQVATCVTQCKNSEDTSFQIKKSMEQIQAANINLQKNKTESQTFIDFSQDISKRILHVEDGIDRTLDKASSLENWIDIYMPLRLQHQITETIRECLNKKGKYLLGIVDNLICKQLREKVFTDIGNPMLQERCLEVIRRLQLDADILSKENKEEI